MAASQKKLRLVEFLLEHGARADVVIGRPPEQDSTIYDSCGWPFRDFKTWGFTPLMLALNGSRRLDQEPLIRLLLSDARTDVNATALPEVGGVFPLFLIVAFGDKRETQEPLLQTFLEETGRLLIVRTEQYVLRARKEVELERHAVGRHIVAMLVDSAHAARLTAQDLCSPGEQGVLHDLEEDAAVRGREVFAANRQKRAARARGQHGRARAKRASRSGSWRVGGRGTAAGAGH